MEVITPVQKLCVRASWHSFVRGFVVAFGLRAAIGIFSRVIAILRKRPLGLFSFSNILGEKHVVFRVEAIRLGMFIGSFSGVYRLLCLFFQYQRAKREHEELKPSLKTRELMKKDTRSRIECYASGVIAAGISVSFLSHDSRRTLALYALARGIQSVFYSIDEAGIWKSMLPVIPLYGTNYSFNVHTILQKHLDAILFVLSSAQIMYSYVLMPHTLPESYWKFIVKTGPIPRDTLALIRKVCYYEYPLPLKELGFASCDAINESSTLIPCSVLHPHHEGCTSFFTHILDSTIKKSWLMYLSLNAFSYLVLGFNRFRTNPLSSLFRYLLSTTRSTFFLACFVAFYQSVVCMHRKTGMVDHRSLYWIAGAFSSLSIFIEKKSRREELALYVFPRAIDSLWLAADLTSLPRAETIIYALSMGFLVYSNEYSPKCIAPLLRSIFKNVLPPVSPQPEENSEK